MMGDKINLDRKDEVNDMDVNAIFQFLGGLVIAGLAAIVGILSIRHIKKGRRDSDRREIHTMHPVYKEDPAAATADRHREDMKEKERLAAEYCRITQAIEDIKSEEIYKNVFLRYARVYQVLIGLARRWEQSDISGEEFLGEIELAFGNSGIARQLSAGGFQIEAPRVQIDRDKYRERCLNKSMSELQNALAKQKKMLLHYQSLQSCKDFVIRTGADMYTVIQAAAAGNVESCKKNVAAMGLKLEECGCFAVFADNPAVYADEGMRVDFMDDTPEATELPGLYTKEKDGKYVLIGTCCGTRRKKDGLGTA